MPVVPKCRRPENGAWRPASRHRWPTPNGMKGSELFPPAVGLGVAGQGRFLEEVPLT